MCLFGLLGGLLLLLAPSLALLRRRLLLGIIAIITVLAIVLILGDLLLAVIAILLAFTAFWAYISFSQFMLIWIANVPEEVPWYLVRSDSGWRPVGIFLALAQFVIPFVFLLSRDRKRRLRPLVFWSVWILVVHYVDVYWVVMPQASATPPASASPALALQMRAAESVGALALAEAQPTRIQETSVKIEAAVAVALDRRAEARMKGYEGESCSECGNFTMVRNGTCLKCDTCGSTSGCS